MRNFLYSLAVLAVLAPTPSFAQYRDYDRHDERDYRDNYRRLGPERRHEVIRLDREIADARAARDWPRVRRLEERRNYILNAR